MTIRAVLALLAAVLACATGAAAQQPIWTPCGAAVGASACGTKGLTRREREDVQALYNAPATRRTTGPFEVPRDSVVRGALAVLGGPVRIHGTVEGGLLVINGDLELDPSTMVTGAVVVLGGRITGGDGTRVGSLRAEPDSVRYTLEDGQLRLEAPLDEVWALIGRGQPKAGIGMRLALTRTYNRVEGLPIEFGPRLRYRTPLGTIAADLFGIFRTGSAAKIGRAHV